jgi:hypothetical protein
MKENDFGIFGLDNSNMDLLWTNTLKIFKNPTNIYLVIFPKKGSYLYKEQFNPFTCLCLLSTSPSIGMLSI